MPAFAGRFALLTLAVSAAVGVGGCKLATFQVPGNNVDSDAGGPIDDPEQYFEANVEAILTDQCAPCHEGQQTGPGGEDVQFLQPGAYYTSVLGFTSVLEPGPIVVAGEPSMSRLLTYANGGVHRGGPFDMGTEAPVSTWIDALGGGPIVEVDAGPEMMMDPVQTEPRRVNPGVRNMIPLDNGTVMLTGASFDFDASLNGTDLILTNIRLSAGPRGISVTQPRLYIWAVDDTEGTPDPQSSRFNQSNFQVEAASEGNLADREVIPDFPVDGRLSVEFVTVQYMM